MVISFKGFALPHNFKQFFRAMAPVLVAVLLQKSQLLVGLLTLQGLGDDLLGPEQKVKDKERKKQLMAALRADIIRFSDFFRNILQVRCSAVPYLVELFSKREYSPWMICLLDYKQVHVE